MTFTHPQWLWLLLLAPVLIMGKIWADLRGRRALDAFTAIRLRPQLVTSISSLRSWAVFFLQLFALAFFLLAVSGPRWGEEDRPQRESGRNLIIAIDCSRSMLADDLPPNRLTRAKLAAQDLLSLVPGDRVGLIVFAGTAYLQAPLTTDHAAVAEAIESIDTFSVPRGGSEIARALKLAVETFEKTPARKHGLVLFSDGGEPESGLAEWAAKAAERNILVLAVGVGTEAGSLIPDPDPNRKGDWVRDGSGNIVRTTLGESTLRDLAQKTGGRYLRLNSQSIDSGVVEQILSALDRQESEGLTTRKPIERFYWPLFAGIIFLMIAWFLRPLGRAAAPSAATVAAVLTLWLVPEPSHAASLPLMGGLVSDRSATLALKAREAAEREDFEEAVKLYEQSLAAKPRAEQLPAIHLGLALAAHRLENFDLAVNSFSSALQKEGSDFRLISHRGLGHSLYDQGDRALAKQPQFTERAWTDSLRHFNAALEIDPENQELIANRDFVKKRLEELQEQQQQEQKQKGEKGDSKQEGEQGEEGEEGEPGEQGQNGQQGQQGEPGQQGQDGDQGSDSPQGQEGTNGDDPGGKGGQQAEESEGDEGGKSEQPLPEGDITADQAGQNPGEQKPGDAAQEGEGERNEATGFSPNEARSFLKTYADDQKAVQYSRPRQKPSNGKDW